jgi:hypothetical protein
LLACGIIPDPHAAPAAAASQEPSGAIVIDAVDLAVPWDLNRNIEPQITRKGQEPGPEYRDLSNILLDHQGNICAGRPERARSSRALGTTCGPVTGPG